MRCSTVTCTRSFRQNFPFTGKQPVKNFSIPGRHTWLARLLFSLL